MSSPEQRSLHLDRDTRQQRGWIELPDDGFPPEKIAPLVGQLAAMQRKLARYGIEVEVNFEGHLLPIEAVDALLRDREAAVAWIAGVTVAQYRTFWNHDWQCRAAVPKGRCPSWVADVGQYAPVVPGEAYCPPDFNPKALRVRFCERHLKPMQLPPTPPIPPRK